MNIGRPSDLTNYVLDSLILRAFQSHPLKGGMAAGQRAAYPPLGTLEEAWIEH